MNFVTQKNQTGLSSQIVRENNSFSSDFHFAQISFGLMILLLICSLQLFVYRFDCEPYTYQPVLVLLKKYSYEVQKKRGRKLSLFLQVYTCVFFIPAE